MCFLHIVNICCQHVIQQFINIELADAPGLALTPLPNHGNQSYKEVVWQDPIALNQNIV
jgi:hypothetical protein